MANNVHKYGFRWVKGWNGSNNIPQPIRKTVATGQDDQDDGSNSVDLNIGDPVKLVSTGGVALALTTNSIYGIISGIRPYWDGNVMRPRNKLPNQTSWGTVEARRSWVDVIPITSGLWEIDADENTSATTFAAYVAFLGENCNHTVPGNTSATSADPYLDISSHATTAALELRLVGISQSAENKDFSGTNVKLYVAANTSELPTQAATTIIGV